MRIAIVTDAWAPQVNGVVTTLTRTAATLETLAHDVRVLSANGHVTIPIFAYLGRVAVAPGFTGVLDEDLSKAARSRPRAERYARIPFGVWRSQGSACGSSRCAAALRSSARVAVGSRTGASHQRVTRPASSVLSLRSTRVTLLASTARASSARSMTKRFQSDETLCHELLCCNL